MFIIPTRTDSARYTQTIELDKVTFTLAFEWNDRAEGWFLDIYDATGVLLLSGVRIVINYPFMNKYRDSRLPAGIIEAVDTSDADLDPGFADLGERVKLVYTPADEIDSRLVVSV